MRFKDDLFGEWYLINAYLKRVVSLTNAFVYFLTGHELTITCLVRDHDKDPKGHHSEFMAVDIRTKDMSDLEIMLLEQFLYETRKIIEKYSLFTYKGEYKMLLAVEPHHTLKGTPQQHIHLHIREAK